ncbi:MAG TPA: MFS transporter [Pseudolabrys sp.]|nr:MFS transporter [Pseudolabrys sp.]
MPPLRDFLTGRWRAVPVLGVTQILAWGAIFYTPVLIVPVIAIERGWSIAFGMAGFSIGLLAAGLSAPFVGRSIDRYGGHVIMGIGSLIGALGLVFITLADSPALYVLAWIVLGLAMGANLYDATFATLGRIFGIEARNPITAVTLAGGLASTVSWPTTFVLMQSLGWRGTYLVYAALFVLVAAPLHAFALPRSRAGALPPAPVDGKARAAVLPAKGLPFLLVAAAFGIYAFVPSGLSAHLLAIFGRAGIEPAMVVAIGALFGPAQVAARLIEFIFARDVHPLPIVRGALTALICGFIMLAVLGFSTPVAALFALMFGGANGLVTIARGAVPLALFGAAGYGRVIGRLAAPFLLMQAAAPLVMAFVIERVSDPAALALTAACALVALVCFLLVRRP